MIIKKCKLGSSAGNEKALSHYTIIDIYHEPNWWMSLLGKQGGVRNYIGSGTVWNEWRDGKLNRCSTSMEFVLCDIEETYKHSSEI